MKTSKNWLICALMLVVFVLCLSGCGNSISSETTNSNYDSSSFSRGSSEKNIDTEQFADLLMVSLSNKTGAYIIEGEERSDRGEATTQVVTGSGKEKYSLIKFIDNKTLKKVVLCNKPGCSHSDSSCNACVPSYLQVKRNGDSVRFPILKSNGYIFASGDKLYTLDPFGDIVEMNKDGTSHQKVLTVDSKYIIDGGYLMGGKLYLNVRYLMPYDSKDEDKSFSDKDYNIALLEIDLQKKSCKELFAFKTELETTLLGLFENKAYYFYKTPNTVAKATTQQAIDDERNGHDVRLYSVDFMTGKREYIKNNLKSFEFDNPMLAEDSIYYHNRKTRELKRINLTGFEEKTVKSDFGGYIECFGGKAVFDDKLFFIKDNQTADAFSEPPKSNETFYLDLKTNEIKKADYGKKTSDGFNLPLQGISAVTSDYFIFYNDNGMVAVKKADFYENKQNFIPIK